MESLRSSEQEAQEIVDAIPQTIAVLSPDGQPVYGNRSLLQYTGLTIAEVTSVDFRARVFHPEDVARLREERRDALARGVPFELEQRARRHDGQYRWFLVQYNPVRDEHGRTVRWYATGTDIDRSEEHTSELQSPDHLVCRLLLEKKKRNSNKSQEQYSTNASRY